MNIPSVYRYKEYSAFLSGQMTLCNYINNVTCDSLGFSPNEVVYSGVNHNIAPSNIKLVLVNQPIYTEYILRLASICNKNNVSLLLFLPPVTNHYVKLTNPTIVSILDSIAHKASSNYSAEYINYFNDERFRSGSLFADEIHLNSKGAILFSQRLKKDFYL